MLITSPRVVSSPAIARFAETGFPVAIDARATKSETPADGPSYAAAPIGMCR
jgi:hypothetical protein